MDSRGPVADDAESVNKLTKEIVARGGRESDEAAAAMIIAGAPPGVIAEELGFPDAEAVMAAAMRAMAGSLTDADKAHLKRIMVERLERLWRSTLKRATDSGYRDVEKATANALRLLDQLAGQLEIKADQTVNVVHSADKAQIDQWVKDVARARIRSFPEELDVLDAEVIDDETPRRDELEGASAPGAPETSDGQTRRLDPEASDVP